MCMCEGEGGILLRVVFCDGLLYTLVDRLLCAFGVYGASY